MSDIRYLGGTDCGNDKYELLTGDGDVKVVEVCDGDVFPRNILTESEEKELLEYHWKDDR